MIRSCSLTPFTVLLASMAGCGEAPTEPGDLGVAMEQLVDVPGKVLDFDGVRTLYAVATEQWQHEIVRIRDADGSDVTIYDVPSRGVLDARAFLFPAGAIFVTTFGSETSESYPTREAMHEYRDGVTSDLEFDASGGKTSTLAVEGSYAAWTEKLPRPGLTLHLRDLVSGETTVIASDATSHDLTAGGAITYGRICTQYLDESCGVEPSYEVVLVPHGEAPITLGSPSEWSTEPVTDGSTVVFRKVNDLNLYGPYQTIMVPVTGGEVALTDPFLGGERPHADYEVQGGWIAYTQQSPSSEMQVWSRSPAGLTRQVSRFSTTSSIEALDDTGAIVFESGGDRYISVPPYSTMTPLGRADGTVRFRAGRFLLLLDGAVFAIP